MVADITEARRHADELLAMFLTPEQREQLAKQSAFVMRSELGKQYRIKRGWSHNVEELDDAGKAIASYCILLSQHACFGGWQQFWQHASRETGTPMRFRRLAEALPISRSSSRSSRAVNCPASRMILPLMMTVWMDLERDE